MAEITVSQSAPTTFGLVTGVCAVTGEPTGDTVRLTGRASQFGPAWLLLISPFVWLMARA